MRAAINGKLALELMRRRGLKWSSLAVALGMDEGNLARILSGSQEPRVGRAIEMARLLGTTVEELFGGWFCGDTGRSVQ